MLEHEPSPAKPANEAASKRPESRHSFFESCAALPQLAEWWEQAASVEPRRKFDHHTASYLVEFSRPAMASQFQVFLNAGQYAGCEDAAGHALDAVAQLEDQLSVFIESSDLSRINRLAYPGPVSVEARLFELLLFARHLNQSTNGAFDISASPLWRLWGFARRSGQVPRAEQLAEALARVGNEHWACHEPDRSVQFFKPGVELNLGSIGKGYALDVAACRLLESGIHDFLLNGGHSSVLAWGNRSGCDGWLVGLAHPFIAARRLGLIRLRHGALGTTSTARQFFYHQGKRLGHVLDPRTGYPVDHWCSVTVLAPCATAADALATAFFVMQRDEIHQYCRQHPELGVILVRAGRRAGEWEVETIQVEPDEFLWGDQTDAAAGG
ncbi:MAG: FAD:protein FMN transferase [Pirellulaceae bacterium]|nr:MAG: FAD:protein FMN transferase [Pirellulaceae bacterium]